MRILVTGSSGHVGGAIARHLLAQGHEVVGLGRRLTKDNRLLSRALAIDLGQSGAVRSVVADEPRCEAIVHAAAAISDDPHSASISLTNGLGTQQVIELAAGWNVASLVYLSSLPLIGRPSELPVTEQHPTDPPTAYHASKLYGEHLMDIARRGGTPTVSLRLTAPVGPGMPDHRIMSAFVARALAEDPLEVAGQGTRGQDYVDVRDIATAVEAALGRRATGVFNIASGRCTSNLELAKLCVDVLGSRSAVKLSGGSDPEEGMRWEVSIDKAAAAHGYRPSHSLEDSISAVAEALHTGPADD